MSISYKYIGSGGFGFVISPNINNNYIADSKYNLRSVSKIFVNNNGDDNEYLVESELYNHKIIDNLDPEFKYHLKILNPIGYYSIEKSKLKKLSISNIPLRIKKLLIEEEFYYINYEFGGITLLDLFEDNPIYYTKKIYIHICNEIMKLIHFIKLLLENKYIHHDLKHNNILIDDNLTFKTIDFGLLEYIPEYLDFCKTIQSPLYEFFPFEIEYYNSCNYNNCIDISKQYNYSSKLQYLRTNNYYFFSDYSSEIYKNKYNEMINMMHLKNHDEFLNASFNSFDIYTLGITLIYLTEKYIIFKKNSESFDNYYNSTEYSQQYFEWIHFQQLKPLILKMITPNVFERITIDDLLIEFENYIRIIV